MIQDITIHSKRFELYIPGGQIDREIGRMAREITRDYAGTGSVPLVVVTLNGAFMFAAELARNLGFNCEFVFIKCSSYDDRMCSSGPVRFEMELMESPAGRDVIVLEDIVETGNTYVALNEYFKSRGANSIRIAAMLLKESRYDKELPIDYVGFKAEDRFLIGYGLDYNRLGRNLDGIYRLAEE